MIPNRQLLKSYELGLLPLRREKEEGPNYILCLAGNAQDRSTYAPYSQMQIKSLKRIMLRRSIHSMD